MKVSIITGTYDSAKTIRDTLVSIQDQTYQNVEHIIIDGASKDSTLDIVSEYPHVQKIISEPDKGIYDAMNKGVALATGDIVGILNSDDIYQNENVLSSVVEMFQAKDKEAVYGNLVYVDNNDLNKVIRNWESGPFERKNFLNGWMPPHPTFFVRREIYEKYGTFDLSFKSAADYELILRFLYKYKISCEYISEILVRMRVGGHSNSSLLNRIKANREDKRAWSKNGLKPKFYTTWMKPIRKITQYIGVKE